MPWYAFNDLFFTVALCLHMLSPSHGYVTLSILQTLLAALTPYTQTSRHASQLRDLYRTSLRELKRLKDTGGIAAGVYTQTTDVEGEINGLLTYDRKVSGLVKRKI